MTYELYIEIDGRIAEISIPEYEGSDWDVWQCLADAFPSAYDLIDEDMVVPTYGGAPEPDARFGEGDAAELADWIVERKRRSGSVPESVTAYKQIRTSGRTLIVYVKEECDRLGIGYGDWVEVTVRKAERHG